MNIFWLVQVDFPTYHIVAEQCVIQTTTWAGSVFQASKGSPATFKAELSAQGKPW